MTEKSEQDRRPQDDDKAGLEAADGTPTGSLGDPDERPESGGVLGGGRARTDERPSDPVPQEEVKPGEPDRSGT